MGSKVNILTPGSGEENCNFYCRCQTRSIGSYCSKDLSSLMDFRERFMWVRGCVQLANCLLIGWWWGNQESASSTSWFQPVWGVLALGSIQLTSSTWWVFKYLLTKKKKSKKPLRIWLIILSTVFEEELIVLDYYFVLFDCFLCVCIFFTSLIKCIPWNSGEVSEAIVFLQIRGMRRHRGPVLGRPHRVLYGCRLNVVGPAIPSELFSITCYCLLSC